MSTLYLVSTPIGNLGDMTHRAVSTLGAVSRVLAEDTRHSRVLMQRYDIATPLVSLHEHNEASRLETVIGWLDEGQDLALVSDAGTPLVSDPGARLVAAASQRGHRVVPVPGASAVLAALTASGLAPEPFTFFGFVERSGASRRTRLEEIAASRYTVVLFEAPNRLLRLLEDLVAACGETRFASVSRELTKVHEETTRGTLAELAAYYGEREVRGEIAVVVSGAEPVAPELEADDAARTLAAALLARGERPSAVARELAERLSLSRNRAYELVQALAKQEGESV
ncbi:MAG TPA: 16S rRNA (cytidine(1402)-2'-O)-methyltransferase [Longimicrobiales bacterium]|nr:16S rRNA (cytidine(1402)-2'-O)-methyltransferase [Longimicrobiales bacterium]